MINQFKKHLNNIALLLILLSLPSWGQSKIVGYIPAYKGLATSMKQVDLTKVTHLNIAF